MDLTDHSSSMAPIAGGDLSYVLTANEMKSEESFYQIPESSHVTHKNKNLKDDESDTSLSQSNRPLSSLPRNRSNFLHHNEASTSNSIRAVDENKNYCEIQKDSGVTTELRKGEIEDKRRSDNQEELDILSVDAQNVGTITLNTETKLINKRDVRSIKKPNCLGSIPEKQGEDGITPKFTGTHKEHVIEYNNGVVGDVVDYHLRWDFNTGNHNRNNRMRFQIEVSHIEDHDAEESKEQPDQAPRNGGVINIPTPPRRVNNTNNITIQNNINVDEMRSFDEEDEGVAEGILPQTEPYLRPFYKPEVKIYILKTLLLFVSMFCTSLSVLLMIRSVVTYEVVFIPLCIFPIVLIIINIFLSRKIYGEAWAESEDIQQLFEASVSALWAIGIYLYLGGVIPYSLLGCIPTGFVGLVNLFAKDASGAKLKRFLLLLFFGLQIVLISLKIDHFTDWEWEVVFLPFWFYLPVKIYNWTKNCLLFFQEVLLEEETSTHKKTKLLGFLWYLVFHALNVVAFVVLIGISRAYSPKRDFKLLDNSAYVCCVMGGTLFFYTIIANKHITDFIIMFGLIDSHLARVEADKRRNTRIVTFKSEKREEYFVMLSSTYFLPLQQSFFAKGRESFKKIKTMVTNFKFDKVGLRRSVSKITTYFKTPIDIESLKKSKEDLERKLSTIGSKKSMIKKTLTRKSTKTLNISAVDCNERSNDSIGQDIESIPSRRLTLSVDNIDEIKKLETDAAPRKGTQEEVLCYLCFTNPPDCILIHCGHGGICYECATALVEKKNECMECRSYIEAIYKIDPNPKFSDIVKASERIKILARIR